MLFTGEFVFDSLLRKLRAKMIFEEIYNLEYEEGWEKFLKIHQARVIPCTKLAW